MHNAYFSSTVYALRSKGSLPFCFNDYNSYYFLNERFDRIESHSSFAKCCSCCGVSTHRKAPLINSYSYGPRQSSLLPLSAYRKLIFGGGGDRYCNYYCYSSCSNGSPSYSLERVCCRCDVSCCVKERFVCNSSTKRRSKVRCCRCRCRADEEGDGAEALLSLLSEEVDEDDYFVRGRKKKKKKKDWGLYEGVVEAKGREKNGVREFGNRKNGELRLSYHGFESAREERSRREEKENQRLEKKGSGGSSSYYSLASSGDFNDESKVHDKYTLLEDENKEEEEEEEEEGSLQRRAHVRRERISNDTEEIADTLEANVRTRKHGQSEHLVGEASSSGRKFVEEIAQTLDANLESRARKDYRGQSENLVGEVSSSRRRFAEDEELQEITVRDDVKRTSQSRIRLDSAEESLEMAKAERRKAVNHHTEEEESMNRNTQQVLRISEVKDNDTRRTSVSQNRSEIGFACGEEYRENASNFVPGRKDSRRQTSQEPVQQAKVSRVTEIYNTNIENTSVAHSQTNISNQVNNTNLISVSYQGSTEPPHPQTGQIPSQRVQSESGSYNVNEITLVRASETERVVDARITSETQVRQESEAISIGMLVGNTSRPGNDQTNETLWPIRPSKELERVSTSQEPLRLDYQASVQHDGGSQTMVVPPRSQSLSRSSVRAEVESGFQSQRVSSTTSESISSSSRRRPLVASPHYSHERSERLESPGEPLYFTAPEDALGSADRLHQSSAQILGEFVESARHEVSSEIQRVEDDKRSSPGGTLTKAPSAEMWDISDPSVFQTPKAEEEPETETTTTDTAIVKRSGRSLWNIIGDIVTLKWGSRSETPVLRSGRRIPSNESAGSETWLSTHESELSKGKSSNGSRSEAKSGQLQVTGSSTPAQGTDSGRFNNRTRSPEAEPSPPMSRMGSESTSKRISFPGGEIPGSSDDGKISRASSSGIEIIESPLKPTVTVSQVSVEQIEQYGPAKAGEVPMVEGSGGELKRRKLQRITQVAKDRFDEWEEAFTAETEQRRLDEMFMREALLEAKNAADTWEVPVGAVLVHNGTIIARGHNLVEELRDSTAHAEMLCIREASSQLRSWRLSDTTLYVTLEPCPMCAGAMLQARISNLVWGAPNKLLGADGSWIRLFPDGGEGANSSDKPAPPAHPFHPNMKIRRGVLATECSEVMQQFFQLRRKKKEKQSAATDMSQSPRISGSQISKLHKKMHDVFHIMFCL